MSAAMAAVRPSLAARALGRHAFDGLERALLTVGLHFPALGLAGAGVIGALRNRLSRRWPSPTLVRDVLGLAPRRAARIAVQIGALEARNRLYVSLLQEQGAAALRAVARWADPHAAGDLRGPAILVTFHVGALHALATALAAAPQPQLLVRWSRLYEPPPGSSIALTGGTLEERAALLRRGLAILERGGIVVTALDGEHGAHLESRCFGRVLRLGRGPFFLALETGAPVRPLVALWAGHRARVELGAPLASGSGDERQPGLARAAGAWLETFLRRHPAQASLGLLRRLADED